jgi:centrin-3
MKEFFVKYDKDENGIIDFREFLAMCIDVNTKDTEQNLSKLFSAADQDGNRKLTHEELRAGIALRTKKNIDDDEVTALIEQLDVDADGEISYNEFTTNLLMQISESIGKGK